MARDHNPDLQQLRRRRSQKNLKNAKPQDLMTDFRQRRFWICAAAAYALIAAALAIIGAAVVPPAEHGFVPIHECAELVIEEQGGCTNVFGR